MILIFTLSYIIGVICWAFIVYKEQNYIRTYGQLLEGLMDTPAFIPIANIIIILGGAIMLLFLQVIKYIGIEKLWNKIKDKKIRR